MNQSVKIAIPLSEYRRLKGDIIALKKEVEELRSRNNKADEIDEPVIGSGENTFGPREVLPETKAAKDPYIKNIITQEAPAYNLATSQNKVIVPNEEPNLKTTVKPNPPWYYLGD